MDNLDDSENIKISDSAYSNSCSNSQSRRSHSSKSTHSGSSGSSGYGGKPSTGSSNNLSQLPAKRSKDIKKKKQVQVETVTNVQNEVDCRPPESQPISEAPKEEIHDVVRTPSMNHTQPKDTVNDMSTYTLEKGILKNEVDSCSIPALSSMNIVTSRQSSSFCTEGFSCVISMHDGVVMYTTASLTTSLGFPKDMWIGRSFIDFVHPRDRNTFASQITSGLTVPKNTNETQEKVLSPNNSVSTMFCRIRRYRGLTSGFGVKDRVVTFMPFLLKLSLKNVSDEEGNFIYLVIQATPFVSAYKTPNEIVSKCVPFVMRHVANGNFEYIDSESVPYLGYLPQDIRDKDALQLYHPNDLDYLQQVYETIVKEGSSPRSKPYRFMTQNGHYVKLETEWSSFINPWSKKLEFVIGKHHIIEGPSIPDVFQSPELDKCVKFSEEEKNKAQALRQNIVRIMNELLTKPAELAKQQMSKRCQDLASFMETLMEEQPKTDDEIRLEILDPDNSYYERDSVMLGGISPHHDYNESISSTETPMSYNQLNYNETLQRYFDSLQPYSYVDYNTVAGENILGLKDPKAFTRNILSPMTHSFGDSGELISSCESSGATVGNSTDIALGNYQPVRLTETMLTKHNVDMEKELVKKHRESRSSSKQDKDKVSNETRQKKKEHFARCNASFQATAAGASTTESQHGVKRASKQTDMESGTHKLHCSTSRQSRRRQTTSSALAQPSSTITTTVGEDMNVNKAIAEATGMSITTIKKLLSRSLSDNITAVIKSPRKKRNRNSKIEIDDFNEASTQWPANSMSNINAFVPGIGIPQQMSIMSPVAAVPGVFPMYCVPAAGPPIHTNADVSKPDQFNATYPPQYPSPAVQYMMYGQAVFGSPFVYSPISPPVSFPLQQTLMAQTMNTPNPLGLTSSNYEEACKSSLAVNADKHAGNIWREKKRAESQALSSKAEQGSGISSNNCSSTSALNRESGANSSVSQNRNRNSAMETSDIRSNSPKSTEVVPDMTLSINGKNKPRMGNSDETIDRTDESSYSSFYSSFFKTESGSAEESGDVKKAADKTKSSYGHLPGPSSDQRSDTIMHCSPTYISMRNFSSIEHRDRHDLKDLITPGQYWDKNATGHKAVSFQSPLNACNSGYETHSVKKVARMKMEPPWMEQVCVTPELIYKYQIMTKSMAEVLSADKQKLTSVEQPSLVNEQLGQLYLDLQLEGVAARLTLEEGITSSGSSGEETSSKENSSMTGRRQREYSKLVMIYEENAPLPPPAAGEDNLPSPSTF